MINFEQLKNYYGKRCWDFNSQQWFTIEKSAILSKEQYIQFKEIDYIVKYKDYNLYLIEIRK